MNNTHYVGDNPASGRCFSASGFRCAFLAEYFERYIVVCLVLFTRFILALNVDK